MFSTYLFQSQKNIFFLWGVFISLLIPGFYFIPTPLTTSTGISPRLARQKILDSLDLCYVPKSVLHYSLPFNPAKSRIIFLQFVQKETVGHRVFFFLLFLKVAKFRKINLYPLTFCFPNSTFMVSVSIRETLGNHKKMF